jgi:DNA polymerase elongation subunit (family B)/ribosomal protein S27AE
MKSEKEIVYKEIEGTDAYEGVCNIEADIFEQQATLYLYDSKTKESSSIKEDFNKFIHLRNFDLMEEFFKKSIDKIRYDISKFKKDSESEYIDNIINLEINKLSFAKQPKGFFAKLISDIEENQTVLEHIDNNIKDFIESKKESYSKNIHKTSISNFRNDKQHAIVDKIFTNLEKTIYSLSTNDLVDIELEIDTNKDYRDDLKKQIETYEEQLNSLINKERTYQNVLLNHIEILPSMSFVKEQLLRFNQELNLKFDRLYLKQLFVLKDSNYSDYERLKYGYTFRLYTTGNFYLIQKFIKEYLNLDIYSQAAKDMDLFLVNKIDEQFLIDRKIRFFKGIDSFKDLKRVTFDIETTELYPIQAKCKSCGKVHNHINLKEINKPCNQIINGIECRNTEFDIIDFGRIFNISYKTPQGEQGAFVAEVFEKEGEIIITPESERNIVKQFLEKINELNPEILETYNGEFFDFNYIITKIQQHNIQIKPVKCINCCQKPNDDTFKEKNGGLLKPFINKKGKAIKFVCDNDNCNFEFNIHEINNIENFTKRVSRPCAKCDNGTIKYDNLTNRFKCSCGQCSYTLNSFSKNISIWGEKVKDYILTSRDYKKPIEKSNKPSSLKLGGEVEQYYKTIISGRTVLDDAHAVRGAMAINSKIKSWSLKYIANFAPLKAKQDRTFIQGGEIFKLHLENKNFIITNDNVYKIIPNEYQNNPNEFLETIKKGEFDKISDIDSSTLLPNKDGYYSDDEENDNDSEDSFIRISNRSFYKKYSNEFRIIKGSKIVEQYALDDVYETEKVGNFFQDEKFNSIKFFPMSFQTYSTAGTASSLNVIFTSLCYAKDLAIPHRIGKIAYVGGLSRAFLVGYAERIYKLDYSSLYPSLELALGMLEKYIPFAPDVLYILMYGFDKRFYWKDRTTIITGKKGDLALKDCYDKFINYIKEDNDLTTLSKVEEYSRNGNDKEIISIIKDYEKIANGKQNALKVKFINSLFGAIFSDIALFGSSEIGNWTTSSGRMFLRSAIYYSLMVGCKPTVADTDGYNISVPLTVEHDFEGNKLETPIGFDELSFNGKKGIDAISEYFNKNHLPKTSAYMKLSLDEVDDANIIAKKKNYLNFKDNKVKEVGNSFKSSNIQKYIKNFLDTQIVDIFKTKNLYDFVNKVYDYRIKIIKNELAVSEIVKIKKVKKSVQEYLNRGVTKTGSVKAEEVHMELVIKHDLKPVMGEIINFVNIGNKKNLGDNKLFKKEEFIDLKVFRCKTLDLEHKIDTKDFNEKTFIFQIKGKKLIQTFDKLYNKVQKRKGIDQQALTLFNNIISNLESDFIFNYETYPIFRNSIKEEDVYSFKSLNYEIGVCYKCSSCGKKKIDYPSDVNIFGISNFSKNCEKCKTDTYEVEKVNVGGMEYASVYIDSKVLDETPNKIVKYNTLQSDEAFIKKIIPLKVIFPKEVQDRLFSSIPNNYKHTDITGITEFVDNERNYILSKNLYLVSRQNDTMEELFTMEDKEHRFWDSTKMNPKAIFEKIHITKPTIFDEYNDFCDKLNIYFKYKNLPIKVKREEMYCGEGEYFLKFNNEKSIEFYEFFKKENGNFVLKDNISKKFFINK